MDKQQFLDALQREAAKFTQAVTTDEGGWIVKGFIDVYRRVYTISVDTKVVSKVLELLLYPEFVWFAAANNMTLELAPQQNFYPDLTFTSKLDGTRFAVDIKSTYRKNDTTVNGMTLGAFTGYFRERSSNKFTLYPYKEYAAHYALGVIYSQQPQSDPERQYTLEELADIPSVISGFEFFAQPKYCIAATRPGSGNTKNIGSVTKLQHLLTGNGPFAQLGENVYDDYWMYYLTNSMARDAGLAQPPYTDLKTYLDHIDHKSRIITVLQAHAEQIQQLAEEEAGPAEEE